MSEGIGANVLGSLGARESVGVFLWGTSSWENQRIRPSSVPIWDSPTVEGVLAPAPSNITVGSGLSLINATHALDLGAA